MFKFKQFTIYQDKCAMKVGTDGVLLGAWAPISHNPQTILDIGSGTGLIALMLAQRSNAEQIDALEIDEDAYEQSVENFENSPWADRLFCFHAGLDEFADDPDTPYDLIISNPPFYSQDFFPDDEKRKIARFADALPFEGLVSDAASLLSDEGIFAVIIPYTEEAKFIEIAKQNSLYPSRITRVRGTAESAVKRSLISFGRFAADIITDELTLEISRHQYTDGFKDMVKDFYLKL